MPLYPAATLRTELRNRTHDDAVSPYASDPQIDGFFASAAAQLVGKVGFQAQVTQAGTGTSIYTIPTTVSIDTLLEVGVQPTGNPLQYAQVGFSIFAGIITLNSSIGAASEIVYKFERPQTSTDNISEQRFEMWVLSACVQWCFFAMAHRADFEQWAATNRSDTRIAEVRQLQSAFQSSLNELVSEIRTATQVVDTN